MKSKVPKKQHADVVFISVICFHNKKNIAIIFHHSPWSDLRSLDAQICIPFPGSGPRSSLDFDRYCRLDLNGFKLVGRLLQ